MGQLCLELTVRSLLIAAAAFAAIVIIRVRTAAARHTMWAAAMLAMLLLPVWIVCGPKARFEVLPGNEQGLVVPPAPPTAISSSIQVPDVTPTIPAPSSQLWREVAIGIYLFVMGVLLLRLALGTRRGLVLVTMSEPNAGFRVSPRCVSPVTIGFFRPIVILPAAWCEWPAWKQDAVLTHEMAHAARRDPLVQWLALLNRAIFWFHPLAWWLERQLSTLAEQACDDAVLDRGHDAHDYAQCLLTLARSVADAGVRVNVWGMPMPGTVLSRRIYRILGNGRVPSISRARLRWATMSFALTSLVLAAGTPERMPPVPQLAPPSMPPFTGFPITRRTIAQVHPAPLPIPLTPSPSEFKPAFQSASITFTSSIEPLGNDALRIQPSGKLEIRGAWLPGIIMNAYGAKGINFAAYGIRGPKPAAGQQDWCLNAHYDIVAQALPGASAANVRTMLQALLEDRFKLRIEIKEETFPSYDLVVAESGPKLQPSNGVGRQGCQAVQAGDNAYRECRNLTMQAFAGELAGSGIVGDVINATGLAGVYDFSLPGAARPGIDAPDVVAAARTAAFEAVAKLGLNLVLHPRPIPMILVDHIEPLGWVQ